MVMPPMFSRLLGPIKNGSSSTSEIFNKIKILLSKGVYIFYSKQNIDKHTYKYYGENSDTAICIITTNDKNVFNLPIKSQKFEIN